MTLTLTLTLSKTETQTAKYKSNPNPNPNANPKFISEREVSLSPFSEKVKAKGPEYRPSDNGSTLNLKLALTRIPTGFESCCRARFSSNQSYSNPNPNHAGGHLEQTQNEREQRGIGLPFFTANTLLLFFHHDIM